MINYYLITKPGIVLGNLITVAAGFLLASNGSIDLGLFAATLLGLGLIMASACIFNNYIDRHLDEKMERTKHRALVKGLISPKKALAFATFLGILGHALLYFYTNLLTVLVAAFGFFVYVILYSLWKSRTIYGTAIGSVAGAVPPVVGYCAVKNEFDVGAMILFLMLVLWQMPHFFSIAIFHSEDYTAANIPVLPIKKGILRTQIHMVLYISAFLMTALMLTVYHYTGFIYLAITASASLTWLGLCLRGFRSEDPQKWGGSMFRLSLITITAICLVIPFDLV